MANRFRQAPNHGGSFRSGQPTLLIVHSLEAPARKGLAWDLANGWLQTAPVSPHSITDPVETVDCVRPNTIGWHCGNGNQKGVGLEVTGYAAWSRDEWLKTDAFAAIRLDAKRGAEYAKQLGIPMRWLSLNQIRNGESGFCFHADISATLGGTNHWDPGPGFPADLFMKMVHQWAGQPSNPEPNPNPQPGGPGGAQPEDDDMAGIKDDFATQVEFIKLVQRALNQSFRGEVSDGLVAVEGQRVPLDTVVKILLDRQFEQAQTLARIEQALAGLAPKA